MNRKLRIASALLAMVCISLSLFPILGSQPHPSSSPTTIHLISSLPLSMELTWNSQSNETKESVQTGDVLSGDHVALWADFDTSFLDGAIQSTYLYLLAIDHPEETTHTEFWVFPGFGSHLYVDTHIIGRNGTFEADFSVTTSNDSIYTYHYASITIHNFISPKLDDIIIDSTTATIAILWNFSDINQDETHLSHVFLSSDEGETFQLLMSNITGNSADWDSTGFMARDYMIKVRVIDSSGLSAQIVSSPFYAGTVNSNGGPWPPPYEPVVSTFAGPEDLSYNWGSIGNTLSWNPVANFAGEYVITRNGIEVARDAWSGGTISLNIDGLYPGVYRYGIRMYSVNGFVNGADYVMVTVDPVPSPFLGFAFGIAGASMVIIFAGARQIYDYRKRGRKQRSAHNYEYDCEQ